MVEKKRGRGHLERQLYKKEARTVRREKYHKLLLVLLPLPLPSLKPLLPLRCREGEGLHEKEEDT